MNHKKNVIILVITAILFICAGIWYYQDQIEKDETAGWKTYTNKQSDYTFNLKMPVNWFIEENTSTDDYIKNAIKDCEKDYAYGLGNFRLKSHNYPKDFLIMGFMPEDAPNGAILEIDVICSLDSLKYKNSNNGETDSLLLLIRDGLQEDKDYQQSLSSFQSIYHNGLEYRFMPVIYIKDGATESEKEKLKAEFLPILNQMLYTFEFIK